MALGYVMVCFCLVLSDLICFGMVWLGLEWVG